MEVGHRVRVDSVQVKGPGCFCCCTIEGDEEITEDLGFLVVRYELMTVPSESKDFVLPKALQGRHVEEFCVFPSMDGLGNFSTPSPICHFLLNCSFKDRYDDLTSEEF